MRIQPELDELVWVRFVQAHLSEKLEGPRRDGFRVRHKTVSNLQSIDVGLVFLPAAVTVNERLRYKGENGDDQQQSRQGSPIRCPRIRHLSPNRASSQPSA